MLTLNFFDNVDCSNEYSDAVVACPLLARVFTEEKGVVGAKVSVVLHADPSPLHPRRINDGDCVQILLPGVPFSLDGARDGAVVSGSVVIVGVVAIFILSS